MECVGLSLSWINVSPRLIRLTLVENGFAIQTRRDMGQFYESGMISLKCAVPNVISFESIGRSSQTLHRVPLGVSFATTKRHCESRNKGAGSTGKNKENSKSEID